MRQVIIPAGGMGRRLGAAVPKALAPLRGQAILLRTLAVFDQIGLARTAIVVIPEDQRDTFKALLDKAYPGHSIALVEGGVERQDSVRNGLSALDARTVYCAIHDAARPFVSTGIIEASFEAAEHHGAATIAVPAIDTVLVGDAAGFLQETPDRARVWYCQTPQTFRADLIRDVHERAAAEGVQCTDDATLVRWAGHPVKLVQGGRMNIKVTTPADIVAAEAFIEKNLQCE